jgi:hypothetical protein
MWVPLPEPSDLLSLADFAQALQSVSRNTLRAVTTFSTIHGPPHYICFANGLVILAKLRMEPAHEAATLILNALTT